MEGEAPLHGPIARCPEDGTALVPIEALRTADGDPFLGATIAGRFVIVGKLGAGSMGTVYRARQEAMGRDVALKILRADRALDAMAKARFAREARAMSLLSSPHTVTVFDFGETPDPQVDDLAVREASLFLAMELLEGESLGARLKRRGRLPVEEAVRVAREALLSLAEAHDKGIIHRDLKPDNLFLARVGASSGSPAGEIVKVLDFGIAKLRVERRRADSRGETADESSELDALETQAGTVFGTPRYMSPEQAQGKDLDARSDLYTLGVLLYHMLVGRPPFVDDDAVVVMARHIKSTAVPPLEAVPDAALGAALSALVMRALAKRPDDRPHTAQVFLAELDRAVEERGSDRPAPSRWGETPHTPRSDLPLPQHPRPAAGASEATRLAHDAGQDGLGLSPVSSRKPVRRERARAGLLLSASAAVVIAAGLFALGMLRTAHVASARPEIVHLVAARRLALLQAEVAASAAAPAALEGPSVTATPGAAPPPTPAPPASQAVLDGPASGPKPRPPAEATRATDHDEGAPAAPAPAGSSAKKPRAASGKRYRKFDL